MHDMGISHLHFSTQKAAAEGCPSELDHIIPQVVSSAQDRIKKMFDALANLHE